MAQYRVSAYKCVLVRESSILLDKKITGLNAAIELTWRELADPPDEQVMI